MSVANPAPVPTLQSSAFPRYSGPGYAEIKPHNVDGIRAGLAQLCAERPKRQRLYEAKVKAHKPGTPPPKPSQPYLLTYDYQMPKTVAGTVTLTGHLLVPKDACSVGKPADRTEGRVRSWLDTLGEWWSLGSIPGPEHTLARWRSFVGPAVFGSMVEPVVRQAFFDKFGKPTRHLTLKKSPSIAGPDVDWLEVAEFLYELASELGEVA